MPPYVREHPDPAVSLSAVLGATVCAASNNDAGIVRRSSVWLQAAVQRKEPVAVSR
jgi:hypothetical protein